jgi:hypothetical protein
MLQLHFSNRFQTLSAQLLQRLAATPAGPFDVDTVVVPSAAVRPALTLARLGELRSAQAQAQSETETQ